MMIDAYAVWIQDSHRWLDSIWLKQGSAQSRKAGVLQQMEAAIGPLPYGVTCWVSRVRVEDAKLTVKTVEKDKKKP